MNAVAHRDYSIKGTDIQIKMFDDHFVVESPGILPGLVRVNNIREFHFSRNPKVVEFLNEYDLVKEFGEGVDRIFRDMQDAGLPEPEYKQSEFMLYATLKNKTWGLENGSWESLTGDNPDSGQVSGQVSGQAGGQVSGQTIDSIDKQLISDLMAFCSEPRTRTELQTFCKVASRDYFRNHILNPMIDAGLLIRTIPDKPNSPKQKYEKAKQ